MKKEKKRWKTKTKTRRTGKKRFKGGEKRTIDQTLNLKRQTGNGWTSIGHKRKKVTSDVIATGWDAVTRCLGVWRVPEGHRSGSFPRRYFTRHLPFSVSSRCFIVALIFATGSLAVENQPPLDFTNFLRCPSIRQRVTRP